MRKVILLLCLLGMATAKREIVLSPPPAPVQSPPPPGPPAPPSSPQFDSPALDFSLVFPGYTQATFGATQQADLCRLIITTDPPAGANEECVITSVNTYNGTNALVDGFVYFKWTVVPTVNQLNTAFAIRDAALVSLKNNATIIFAPTFAGVYPNCACTGTSVVTASSTEAFTYNNVSSIPGPVQCGSRLIYDAASPVGLINNVGIDDGSVTAANFGKYCSPVAVAGGVTGTPGVPPCRQYGVIASNAGTTQAQPGVVTLTAAPPGAVDAIALGAGGAGYTDAPTVTISLPNPLAAAPVITLDAAAQPLTVSVPPNGPYSGVAGDISATIGGGVCVDDGNVGGICTGAVTPITDAAGVARSGPICRSQDFNTAIDLTLAGGVITAVAFPNAVNVFCASTPTITLSTNTLQSPGVQAKAIATVGGGAVTGYVITNGGSGYRTAPTVTVSAPSSQNVGKLCSSNPIPGLPDSIAVSAAVAAGVTTAGQCQPLGRDTYFNRVCSVPASLKGGVYQTLNTATCNAVSSFRAQPTATTTDSCLILPQTVKVTVTPPSPAPAPPSPAPAPPSPAPAPPSPIPICTYKGVYEIIPLYGPCNKYRIAAGTDSDCDYNLVTLRTAGQVGQGKITRLHWEFSTIAEGSISVPTNVLSRARTGCTNKYLAAPSDPTTLKTGGASWKWQFVPYPGSSKCDEVNVISQNRLSTTAFLEVPKSCDRFRYNATDGGRQRFRLRKITL